MIVYVIFFFFYFFILFIYLFILIQDGIKLLNTWLVGEKLIEFCKYIGGNTSMLKPNEVPHGKTISRLHIYIFYYNREISIKL